MKIENNILHDVNEGDVVNGTFVVPEGVTTIGIGAFKGCSGLTNLTLPEGLTTIGNGAFYDCSDLTSLTLPASLTAIGNDAFHGCSGLTNLTLPAGLTAIGDWAFSSCRGLTNLTLPEGLTTIGNYAFSGCSGLTNLTLPASLTAIGNGVFEDCSGLTNLTLPEGLTAIGNWAFNNCSGLTSLTLPASLTAIGNGVFAGCSGLTNLTLPASLTAIGNGVFEDCSGLTSLTLPAGLTAIGDWAFDGCSGLTSLTIPTSLTTIDDDAFSGCNPTTIFVLTESEAEFARIKAMLPSELQDRVSSPLSLNKLFDEINQLLKEHPQEITDEKKLEQLEASIEEAQRLLEYCTPNQPLYQQLKQTLDSLIISVHFHQNDVGAAVSYWLDEKPLLSEAAMASLASAYFSFEEDNDKEKHQAMIALFKANYQDPAIYYLLSKSAFRLLTNKAPSPGDDLSNYADKFVPLAVMKAAVDEVIAKMNEQDPFKKPLANISNYMHLLTQSEIKRLLSIPPIKTAFENDRLLGSSNILPFESCYQAQPPTQNLSTDDLRFLTFTTQLITLGKRAAKNNTLEKQIENSIASINEKLRQPDQVAAEARAEDNRDARVSHNPASFFSHPQPVGSNGNVPSPQPSDKKLR